MSSDRAAQDPQQEGTAAAPSHDPTERADVIDVVAASAAVDESPPPCAPGHRATGTCARPSCFAPDSKCVDGEEDHQACGDWQGIAPDSPKQHAAQRPNWTGRSFGTVDLELVAAIRRPRVVALVGAAGAGKTSALATFFLALRRGCGNGGLSFAGSYTLVGWHDVSRHLGFPPGGSRGFPPHTTSSGGRQPALLHVRLATAGRECFEVLFTDVPGEWFEEWAYDEAAGEGAGWIAERADVFAVLSDSSALSGESRGLACNDYAALAARVSALADNRSVIPIRSKADIDVPAPIEARLAAIDQREFGTDARRFSVVSADDSSPALTALDEVLAVATQQRFLEQVQVDTTGDPFLDLRSPALWST